MKNIISLIVLTALLSCSSDDSNESNNSNQNVLSKIISTTYIIGEPETILTKTYENNRPKSDSAYITSNDISIHTEYTYSNDKLVSRQFFQPINQLVEEFNIVYDELNRITQTSRQSINTNQTTVFTYTNAIITSERNTNGNLTTKSFHLNNDGIIFKEVNDIGTSEITYDNDYNVISFSEPSSITTYVYDHINIPPENFQQFESFMFGDYKNNIILHDNSIGKAIFSDISLTLKYPLSSIRESIASDNVETYLFEWILTEENYPIRRNTYNDDQLIVKFDYFFE